MNNQIYMWDNWYCAVPENDRSVLAESLSDLPQAVRMLEGDERCFVLGYLNADRTYYDGELGPNQHHFHSRVGTGLTVDFESVVTLEDKAFTALDRECSIWSGSFALGPINSEGKREYLFFYTYRDPESPFSFSQRIGVARTTDFRKFSRLPNVISADSRWYEQDSVLGDTVIHSFRDPFPFCVDGSNYLLISAKSNSSQLERGEIGKRAGSNGVIAVYKFSFDEHEVKAEATPLCFACSKPEMEVASLYFDQAKGEYILFFNAHGERDYLSRTADNQGLPVGSIDETGYLYEARLPDLKNLLCNPPHDPVIIEPVISKGISSNSYANRLIPEHSGISLGFDLTTGQPVRGAYRRPELRSVLSNFSI